MKLRQQLEDFAVEEKTDVVPAGEGPFALYRMEKRGWSTPDAVQALRRRWQLDLGRVSYGGLKDRHAHTIQYLTIYRGPQRRLTHHGVHLEYLGQVNAPYTSKDIRANRFRLILRDLRQERIAPMLQALEEAGRDGVPSYFDDQRFGSVEELKKGAGALGQISQLAMPPKFPEGEFVARLMVLERYEEALRQALAGPYAHDRAAQKKEKEVLRAHWGDWARCKELLPRGHARSLADYLRVHPGDFRGALARLRPELRGLYLSAYQSFLWNRMLARWIEQHFQPEQLFRVLLRLGNVPMPRGLDETQHALAAGLQLPLPSARLKLDPADPLLALVQDVLAEEGLELDRLKLKGIKEMFFSKGQRAAWFFPGELSHEIAADEINPRRRKMILAFELPRGCYATLLVKRVTAGEARS